MKIDIEKHYKLIFGSIYPLYVAKVERKGKTKEELDVVISWLTGYDQKAIQHRIDNRTSFLEFFQQAPAIHPNASKITGVICGIRVEEIEDEIVQKIRYLDKLVDEVAKGKAMEKILRK